MGGCASSSSSSAAVNSSNKESSDSKMMTKLRLAFSPHKSKEDLIIISSPLKHNQQQQPSITLRSHSPLASLTGSKEETFFDSKAWIDSDCDDDFLSVKGDFTPSQGSTPVHHNFSIGTPQVNKSFSFNDSSAEPSPNKKKRLSELFQESLREDKGVDSEDHSNNDNIATSTKDENKSTTLGLSPKSVNGSTMLKEKTVKSSQCCLPMMLSSRSFNERSKMSPAKSVG